MKCVKGERGYVDCMISGNMMGEQYVMVSKSVIGRPYMKETDGKMV